MLTIRRVSKLIVILFLFLWAILAFSRTFYNVSKIITESKSLIFVSENQKYSLIYGDLLPIYKKIKSITNKKYSIYLITDDGKSYFLLRYLLYPEKIYWINSRNSVPKTNINSLLLFYHKQQSINGKNLIFTIGTGKEKSDLYKI